MTHWTVSMGWGRGIARVMGGLSPIPQWNDRRVPLQWRAMVTGGTGLYVRVEQVPRMQMGTRQTFRMRSKLT